MQLPTFAALALGFAALAAAQQQSAASIIVQIAPESSSCDGKSDECRTAEQAAPFIIDSMMQYGIYHINQIAAVLSLMALESGDFAYKRNAFPGRPGQGTANMQMPRFNLKYAQSLEGVKDKVTDITSTDGLSDAELNRILDLVIVDEHNFGSAPWFLRSECTEEVLDKLITNVDDGFKAYMDCVGVKIDETRLEYLERAKAAFGIE